MTSCYMTGKSHALSLSLQTNNILLLYLNPNPKVCPYFHLITPSKSVTLPQISISYRVLSKLKSLWPNNIIRSLLMCSVLLLLISKQVIKSLSRLSSSKPLSLQKSFLKNISNPTKLFPSLIYYCLPFIFQSLYALFIQFFMCLCLNLLHLTLSLREYNQPPLQL